MALAAINSDSPYEKEALMKRNPAIISLVLAGCLAVGSISLHASPALKLSKYGLSGFGGPHFKLASIKGKTVIFGGGPAARSCSNPRHPSTSTSANS
jgi:hypothetical protein